MSTSIRNLTPAKRLAVAVAALGYIFASHDALAGGWVLQAIWIVLGLGLVRALIGSIVPTALGWPIGRTPQSKPEPTVAAAPRVTATLKVAESV